MIEDRSPTFVKFCQSCKGTYLLALGVDSCPRCFSNLLLTLKEMETAPPKEAQQAVLFVPNRHERRKMAKLVRGQRD